MSATACAENGGQATATASGEATATAVASAATQTYAAAYASLASCLAPPAGAAPAPSATQCVVLPNTNLDGTVLLSTTAPDVGACCARCQDTPGCNVLSFCPLPPPGCDDGSGAHRRDPGLPAGRVLRSRSHFLHHLPASQASSTAPGSARSSRRRLQQTRCPPGMAG